MLQLSFFFLIVEKILNTRVLLLYTCQGNCRSPPPICVLFLAEFDPLAAISPVGLEKMGEGGEGVEKTQMLLHLQGNLSPHWNSSYFWILPKVSPRFPGRERNRIRKEQTRVTESRSGLWRPPRCSRGRLVGGGGRVTDQGQGSDVFEAVKLLPDVQKSQGQSSLLNSTRSRFRSVGFLQRLYIYL